MTQLLVIAPDILAIGPFSETETDIIAIGIVYPKAIIPGYQIVDAELPPNFLIQDYNWVDGVLVKKFVPPPQISDEQAKANYIAMMESRADVLEAEGKIVEALLLRESLK